MLPGQSYSSSAAMKSSPSRRPVRPHSRANRVQEQRRERRNLVLALAQRRQRDARDADAIEQVAPEPALRRRASRDWRWSRRRCARRRVCGRDSPTGWISPLSRNRSSFGWTAGSRSPISSRNSVPRSAARMTPGNASTAPVNAPRRWPNSWLSTSSRGTAEQLNGTNGPRFDAAVRRESAARRLPCRCRFRR